MATTKKEIKRTFKRGEKVEQEKLDYIDLFDFDSHFVTIMETKISRQENKFYVILNLETEEKQLLGGGGALSQLEDGISYEIKKLEEKIKAKIDGKTRTINKYEIYTIIN